MSVPKDYVANTVTDVASLSQAGYKLEKTNMLLNMPVVPDKSIAREHSIAKCQPWLCYSGL